MKYGNVKMKGKREKLLSCGCCVALNKKRFPSGEDLKKIFESFEEAPENKKLEKRV